MLIYAAEGGSVEVLQILLNVGVELRRTFEEATATMIAAESGHLDFVKLLLQTVDSDINAEDYVRDYFKFFSQVKIDSVLWT